LTHGAAARTIYTGMILGAVDASANFIDLRALDLVR